LVRKAISDVTEEVAAFGFGLEELLVLIGGEGEVAIKFTAVEAEIKNPARCNVCSGSQELGFDWLPVQTFCVIRDCAHDSKIVHDFFEMVEVSCRLRRRPETDSTAAVEESGPK
jgi:hypothetical protein